MYQQTRLQSSKAVAVNRRKGFLPPCQSLLGCGDNGQSQAGTLSKGLAGLRLGVWSIQGRQTCRDDFIMVRFKAPSLVLLPASPLPLSPPNLHYHDQGIIVWQPWTWAPTPHSPSFFDPLSTYTESFATCFLYVLKTRCQDSSWNFLKMINWSFKKVPLSPLPICWI